MRPLPIVLGPTGSGKSELGLYLAEALGGEIVNCDSLQIYRYFDIGSAKLSLEERRGIPHHLIDVAEPSQIFSAGDYARAARGVLRDIAARGRTALVVGGSGFYLRALIDGLFAGPGRDEALRLRLMERHGRRPGSLHRILRRLDDAAAARIHPNDVNKTLRALEVRLLEKLPLTKLFETGRDALSGFRPIRIVLNPPREALYRALDLRAERMFERGLVEEARRILALGVPPEAKPFEALGYKQALDVAQGRLSPELALASARMETRRYAKRQLTWFRREREAVWFDGFGGDLNVREQALGFLLNVWNLPPR